MTTEATTRTDAADEDPDELAEWVESFDSLLATREAHPSKVQPRRSRRPLEACWAGGHSRAETLAFSLGMLLSPRARALV